MKLNRLVIKTADYRKSFEFYHDILGLHLKKSWQRSDSWGAIFHCGEILLEIAWFPKGDEGLNCSHIPQRSKTEIFFEVSNINSTYQRISKFDWLNCSSIDEVSWGYKIFYVYDPDNIKVVFGQPI